jgi:NRPS condensation-like uncharacterized protein
MFNVYKKTVGNNILHEIDANSHDLYNYFVNYGRSNLQIHAFLEFDNYIDADIMEKSVKLCVDAEPILRYSFIKEENRFFWRFINDIENITFCTLEKTENKEHSIESFINSPLNIDKAPQIRVKILRTDKNDILCIKMNHVTCDAGGFKIFLHMLEYIYNYTYEGKTFNPKPNYGIRRDINELFKDSGISDVRMYWNPQIASMQPTWAFPCKQGEPETLQLTEFRLSNELNQSLFKFSKEHGFKITDIILTAFYRSLYEILHTEFNIDMEILVTIDLRRYLPSSLVNGICNFSGTINSRIPRIQNESFESNLCRVSHMMSELKKQSPGLHSAAGIEKLRDIGSKKALEILQYTWHQTIKTGKCSPILSNIGVLSERPFKFGNNEVTDIHVFHPAMYAPAFMLGVYTYNSILSFIISYYEPITSKKDVEAFFSQIQNEIKHICLR